MLRFCTFLIPAVLAVSAASASDNQERAKKIFAQYAELAAAFDPAVADLFSDDAKILNTRIYPDGKSKEMTFEAAKYKALIRAAMPAAKARGDTNKFTKVEYSEKDSRVTITATRFSNLKQYASPITLVVGADKDGTWRILEEISQSRP